MAQISAKYEQYNGSTPILVDFAKKDGKGNVIADTYLAVKNYVLATSTVAGTIKVGYTEESGSKKYKVQLDESGNAFVAVPWEDSEKATWTNVTGKPFSSIGDGLKVSSDALTIDTSKVAMLTDLANYLEVSTFNTFIQTTAPATYVKISGFKASYLDANNVAYKDDLTEFITKDVNNLTNYDTSDTVDSKIATVKKNNYTVVTTKPETGEEGINYLVGTAAPYDWYIYETAQGWMFMGKTSLDLTGYVKGSSLTSDKIVLGNSGSNVKASNYSVVTSIGTDNTSIPTSAAINSSVDTKLGNYQKKLSAGSGISIDETSNTISSMLTFTDVEIG